MAELISMRCRVSHPFILIERRLKLGMLVQLDTDPMARPEKALLNIGLIIDHSGSMSGEKLAEARRAAGQLVDQLRGDDVVSVVQFSDVADAVVEATRAKDRAAIRSRIEQIETGGGTNVYKGFKAGSEEVKKNTSEKQLNRCVVLSDGQHYGSPSKSKIIAFAEELRGREGISTSCLGFGEDYDRELLEGMVKAGGGNLYHIQQTEDLGKVFQQEFVRLQSTVAQNVKARVTFPAAAQYEVLNPGYAIKQEGRILEVEMADMESGRTQTLAIEIVAQFNVPGRVRVAQVEVTYTDRTTGKEGRGAQDVFTQIVHEPAQVTEHIDRGVQNELERIRALSRLKSVADGVDDGTVQRDEAVKTIQRLAQDILSHPADGATIARIYADALKTIDREGGARQLSTESMGATRGRT